MDLSIERVLVKDQEYFKMMAYRYTKNEQDAMDLLQDTMYRVLRKISYFKKGTNLKGWISVVMRNIFINQYRKRRRMPMVHIENREDRAIGGVVDAEGEYNLFNEELIAAISSMSERDQQMINLCKAGYSYKEMAERLELPLGTVKSRIHFARKALSSEIKKMNKSSWIK